MSWHDVLLVCFFVAGTTRAHVSLVGRHSHAKLSEAERRLHSDNWHHVCPSVTRTIATLEESGQPVRRQPIRPGKLKYSEVLFIVRRAEHAFFAHDGPAQAECLSLQEVAQTVLSNEEGCGAGTMCSRMLHREFTTFINEITGASRQAGSRASRSPR